MKILDLQNLGYKAVARKDIIELSVSICRNGLLDLSLKDLNAYLAEFWNSFNIQLTNPNGNYSITVNIVDNDVAANERDGLYQIVGDSIIEWLIVDGTNGRESRLAIPSGLVCKVSKLRFLQLVNRATKISNITCSVTINGKKERVF